jgi:hypothetical protein
MTKATANIICIKWGTLFGPEYVNRLYSGVRRHLDRPVRFICMTEHSEGIHPDVEIIPLVVEPFLDEMNAALAVANRQGAMRKVSLFRQGLIPDLDGPILGFDLDVVITGDLEPLWSHEAGTVAMRADWVEARRGRATGHGSVFRFDPAVHGFLYEDLAKDAEREVEIARGSEQRYTSTKAQERGAFSYLPPDMVVSFKHDCLNLPPMNYFRAAKMPANARVVCFHGHPKMPEAVEGYAGSWLRYCKPTDWLQHHWIDGSVRDLGSEFG